MRLNRLLRGASVRAPGEPLAASTPLKVLALFVFLAALAGATYGVGAILGDGAGAQALNASPLHASMNATPGHTVTYPIRITNRGSAPEDVTALVSGLGVEGKSGTVTTFADGNTTVFVSFAVPANATPGAHALSISLLDAKGKLLRERPEAMTLNILGPASGFIGGDSAEVTYVGRIADTGNVFSTNDPALVGQSFKKTDSFPPTISTRALPVQTVPRVTVVPGFYEGMLGMQPGETRTITFGPEKGYGNATLEQRVDRTATIPRFSTRYPPSVNLTPADFASYVEQTHQGNATDYKVGDSVTNEAQTGETFTYRIVSRDADFVRLILDVKPGQRFSLNPFWPDASIVTEASNTSVTFRTDPPVAPGENFTFYSYWPNMSAILTIDNSSIVVQHSPPVGLHYTKPASQVAAAQAFAVKELLGDAIIVTTTNPDTTLGGKSLTFDITMLRLNKGS